MVKYKDEPQISRVFHALSHETRRAVLIQLKSETCLSAQALAKPHNMSLPAISKHLKVLEQAHLINRKIKGRTHLFTVEPSSLKTAAHWIREFEYFWNQSLENLDQFLKKEKS